MHYRRLRAPLLSGQRLIEPPLAATANLVGHNRALADSAAAVWDQPLTALARQARQDLLEAARRYTATYRELPPPRAADAPLIMAGHQPTLFHAGVWFKNFVLDHVARRHDATAVNLLIDNDVAQQAAIRVPTGSVSAPRIQTVAYDRAQPGVPFEACRLLDPAQFASFGQRVAETVAPFSPDPLIKQLWPLAKQAARGARPVNLCLAEARHRLEHQWGLETLEVPLSTLCQQPAFLRFMAHMLAHAERFRCVHNAALDEYRRVNRVRSKTHPVPALAAQEGWLETPFWIWTQDHPQRRALFVRQAGPQSELSDRQGLTLNNVPLQIDSSGDAAVDYLAEQNRQGIVLRPRALMTTLFARLFLSDLFIHGIGGAKYDQLTDAVLERFFSRKAPDFLVVTATAHLPIPREQVSVDDLRALRQRAREFRFHPERHVELTPLTKPLIEEKQKWIWGEPPSRGQRHRALARLNVDLAGFLAEKQAENARRTADVTVALARERILGSREHSFCLFSEATLQPLLLDI